MKKLIKNILLISIITTTIILVNNIVYSAQNTTKSNDANLSNLGIKPNDFSGFKPDKTTYNVKVPENVNEIEVYAKTQSANAKVQGTGKVKLDTEDKEVDVIVTAQDGTTKKYILNISKNGSSSNVTSTESANKSSEKGLSDLKIGNLSLSPEFNTNTYEYEADYIGEEKELQIEAIPTNENYIVDVVKDKELKEGENLITVLVSDVDGENIATYQVTINKKLIDENALAKEKEEAIAEHEKNKKIIAIGIAVILFIIIILIISSIVKHRRYRDNYYEYDEEEYEEDNIDNDEEDYKDEYKEKKKHKHNGKRFK